MPDPVNDLMITVNTPQGALDMVNPLYNYTFHPQPSASDFPPDDTLSKYHSTVRYPNAAGQSQPDLANAQLQANAAVYAFLILPFFCPAFRQTLNLTSHI